MTARRAMDRRAGGRRAARSLAVLLAGIAVASIANAQATGVLVLEWPTLPARATMPAAPVPPPTQRLGPVEPTATRSGATPPVDEPVPRSDAERQMLEREAQARRSVQSTIDEQDRRLRGALAAPVPAAPSTLHNCGPAGCFDSDGRFLYRSGPVLITPGGRPCVPATPGGPC